MIAGPTVGPDGNIYVISDYGGLGAFALSPAGQLLWSNPGNPTFAEYGQLGAEIVFGSGRLYAAFDEYGVASSTIFGLSLGGAQQFARTLGGSDDPFMQQQRQPATGSDGSLYLTAMGGGQRLGPAPRRSRQRRRALELLTVAVERDVASQRRTGRLRLLLAQPRVPGVGNARRRVALDVLRRLDRRPPRGEP